MNTITTEQKIKRMEAELAELRKKQAEEIKAAEKAEVAQKDLEVIKEQINTFNCKYGTEYFLGNRIPTLRLFW